MRVFGLVAVVIAAFVLAVAVFAVLLPLVLVVVVAALFVIVRGMVTRPSDDPRRVDFDAAA